jgi:hypothetical protein
MGTGAYPGQPIVAAISTALAVAATVVTIAIVFTNWWW